MTLPPVATMRLELSGPLLESLTGKCQSFSRERSPQHYSKRMVGRGHRRRDRALLRRDARGAARVPWDVGACHY
jgi:hypothetical protein